MKKPRRPAPAPRPVRHAGSPAPPTSRRASGPALRSRQLVVEEELWTFHAIGASAACPTSSRSRVGLLRVAPEPPGGGGPAAEHAGYLVGSHLAQLSDEALTELAVAAKQRLIARDSAAEGRTVATAGRSPTQDRAAPTAEAEGRSAGNSTQDRLARRRALRRQLARRTGHRPGG